MENKAAILVASHKQYEMPKYECYHPVLVGADDYDGLITLNFSKDNTGDNISKKNKSFCELTGLYWGWKNLIDEFNYIGLVHYRRYFSINKHGNKPIDNVLTDEEVQELIDNYKVIVPKKRKYYIETLYSHYAHTHYASQLDETRKIIESMYPDYLEDYDKVVNQTWGYMFNMFIMRRDYVDKYCTWLFNILFELEKRVDEGKLPDCKDLSTFQARFYGRVSEILFTVWIIHELRVKDLEEKDIKEVKVIGMEKTNWVKKISHFLGAKFFHKKYEHSM